MSEPKRPDDDKRSVERIEAERMYLEADGDIKLVDIASKLGISDSKVRKWKSMDGWEGKLHPSKRKSGKKKQGERSTSSGRERSTKKKENAPRNKGGQIGNKNAVGGAGNPYPVKPLKHGGYSNQFWDGLAEDEQKILEEMNEDPIMVVTNNIRMLTLRQYRLRRAIDENEKTPLYVSGTDSTKTKRNFNSEEDRELYEQMIQEKIESGDRLPGDPETVETLTASTKDLNARLEKELSTVISQTTKAAEALYNMQREKDNTGGDADAIKIWAEKIKIMRSKGGDN